MFPPLRLTQVGTAAQWPSDQYGGRVSEGVRFEKFVYVPDLGTAVQGLQRRQGRC